MKTAPNALQCVAGPSAGGHSLLPPAAQLALVEAAARARQLDGLARSAAIDEAISYVRRTYPEFFR